MVLQYLHYEKCGNQYTNLNSKWCKSCQINYIKKDFTDWTSGIENIDYFIQEMQLKVNNPNDIVFEWIPYSQFSNIKEIGKGGFAIVYSAIWKDGSLRYNKDKKKYMRKSDQKVALKCLYDSQNITNEFLNEVKAYSISKINGILNIYGISQNPNTKDYIMVLDYADGGKFNHWIIKNYKDFDWKNKLSVLSSIINGLNEIHQKQMVHRDFHTGNILFFHNIENYLGLKVNISDMGLSGKVDDILDETKIYGVMPYVAPEVLKRKPYTQAADVYSFGMVMYFVATGRHPFANCAHRELLVIGICNGIRPEINEPEAPKCYIDLMKRCWDSNPGNRPNTIEISELIGLFQCLCLTGAFHCYILGKPTFGLTDMQRYEFEKQFEEAEKYRKANLSFIEDNQLTTHPQAIYTSRLLNPFTKDLLKNLSKCDNMDNNSVEFIDIDFTKVINQQ